MYEFLKIYDINIIITSIRRIHILLGLTSPNQDFPILHILHILPIHILPIFLDIHPIFSIFHNLHTIDYLLEIQIIIQLVN